MLRMEVNQGIEEKLNQCANKKKNHGFKAKKN